MCAPYTHELTFAVGAKVPTPFASLAFEPIDGYSQSVPYHLFVFLFPMHKLTYIVSFVMIQV